MRLQCSLTCVYLKVNYEPASHQDGRTGVTSLTCLIRIRERTYAVSASLILARAHIKTPVWLASGIPVARKGIPQRHSQ